MDTDWYLYSHSRVSNPLDATADAEVWESNNALDFTVNDKKCSKISKLPPFDEITSEVYSRHRFISLECILKRTMFVSGGGVEGELEIKVSKDRACKIGQIAVYLFGFEEVLADKKTKTKANYREFLNKRLLLQTKMGVPSDAVFAGNYDEHGMWPSRAGKTQLPFSIPFADDNNECILTETTASPLPSSYWNSRIGGIRYIIACVVESKIGKYPTKPLVVYREINVIETFNYSMSNEFDSSAPINSLTHVETSELVNQGFLGFSKKGIIKLSANIKVPQTDSHQPGVWMSGQSGFIGIEIQNATTKRVVSLTISLTRRLKTFTIDNTVDSGIIPISVNSLIVYEKQYKAKRGWKYSGRHVLDHRYIGAGFSENDSISGYHKGGEKGFELWDGVNPDETRSFLLDVTVPIHSKSIRYGFLVDVSYILSISVCCAGGYEMLTNRKTISIALPILILNPVSFYSNLPAIKLDNIKIAESTVLNSTADTKDAEMGSFITREETKNVVDRPQESMLTLGDDFPFTDFKNTKRSNYPFSMFQSDKQTRPLRLLTKMIPTPPTAAPTIRSVRISRTLQHVPASLREDPGQSIGLSANETLKSSSVPKGACNPFVLENGECNEMKLNNSLCVEQNVMRTELINEIDFLFKCVPISNE